mgnify:CR=1
MLHCPSSIFELIPLFLVAALYHRLLGLNMLSA